MFNSLSFKYLLDEEDECQAKAEIASNEIKKYLENKSGRSLTSEELMILSKNDVMCAGAVQKLSMFHSYKKEISSTIDVAESAIGGKLEVLLN